MAATMVKYGSCPISLPNVLFIVLLYSFLPGRTLLAAPSKFQITGSVMGWRGESVTNITLMVSGWSIFGTNIYVTNQTDMAGKFSFELVPGFLLSVQVNPDELRQRGYRPFTSREETTTHSNREIDFVALDPAPTAHLRGQLIDSRGHPVGDLSVSAQGDFGWAFSSWQSFGPFPTDGMGNFDVPAFAGTWSLSAASGAFGLILPQFSITIADGVDENGIALYAYFPTAQVCGDVTDAMGNRLTNVYVSAIATSNGVSYSQVSLTDSNGNFKLDVFDAEWRVAINLDYQSQGRPLPPEQTVLVNGTNKIIHFDLGSATNYLRGRVVDNFGAGVSNIDVFASHFSEFSQAHTVTDTDGGFALNLYSGMWSLFLGGTDGFLAPFRKTLYVPPGMNPAEIRIVLQRLGATLSGWVSDPSSNSIPYATVGASMVTNDMLYSISTFTDEQGNFQLDLFDGEWHIVTSDDVALSYFSGPQQFILINGTNQTLHLVVNPRTLAAHLRGKVIDELGAPLTSSISANSYDFSERASITTDAAGSFDILVFSEGQWYLDANGVGPKPLLPPSLSLDVKRGVDQNGIILVARAPTAQISGSVKDDSGRALPGIDLQAWGTVQNTNYAAQAFSDTEGRFKLDVFDVRGDRDVAQN